VPPYNALGDPDGRPENTNNFAPAPRIAIDPGVELKTLISGSYGSSTIITALAFTFLGRLGWLKNRDSWNSFPGAPWGWRGRPESLQSECINMFQGLSA